MYCFYNIEFYMRTLKIVYSRKSKYKYYWLYGDGQKLKLNSKSNFLKCNMFQLNSNYAKYQLVEQNMALSKVWYFLLFIDIITSLFGGGSNGDLVGKYSERTIDFNFLSLDNSDEIIINIGDDGGISSISNVSHYNIQSDQDVYNPRIEKRVKRYKWILFGTIFGLIALAIVGMIISTVFKK